MARRTVVISEEFGLWRIETSGGAAATGVRFGIAVGNLLVAAGVPDETAEELHPGNFESIFDLVAPKLERGDQPASTVR